MLHRILFAHPNPTNVGELYGALVGLGCQVDRVTNGLECIYQLSLTRYDLLIILDVLPWGTGLGVVGVLGEDPDLRSIPVVLLCTVPLLDPLPSGATSVVAGPHCLDQLANAVRLAFPSPSIL